MEGSLPISWVLGAAIALMAMWIPLVISMMSQAKSFGAMETKLDQALSEVAHIRTLDNRVQAVEGWVADRKVALRDAAGTGIS
mgnify:CR=1 FL=1|jgi:hypothetical protein